MIAALKARGVDVVVRLHQRRRADFRCGDRVGRGDHVVLWKKPAEVPEWMSHEEYEAMPPWLEGIKGDDGRWMVIYSKYDIGCALEGHQSLGCLGYDPASALKLARAAVLHNLRP